MPVVAIAFFWINTPGYTLSYWLLMGGMLFSLFPFFYVHEYIHAGYLKWKLPKTYTAKIFFKKPRVVVSGGLIPKKIFLVSSLLPFVLITVFGVICALVIPKFSLFFWAFIFAHASLAAGDFYQSFIMLIQWRQFSHIDDEDSAFSLVIPDKE